MRSRKAGRRSRGPTQAASGEGGVAWSSPSSLVRGSSVKRLHSASIVFDVLPLDLRELLDQRFAEHSIEAVLVVPAVAFVGAITLGQLLHAIEVDVGLAGAHVVNRVDVNPSIEDALKKQGSGVLVKLAAVLGIRVDHQELEDLVQAYLVARGDAYVSFELVRPRLVIVIYA